MNNDIAIRDDLVKTEALIRIKKAAPFTVQPG